MNKQNKAGTNIEFLFEMKPYEFCTTCRLLTIPTRGREKIQCTSLQNRLKNVFVTILLTIEFTGSNFRNNLRALSQNYEK